MKTRTIFDNTDNTFYLTCGRIYTGTPSKIKVCIKLHKKNCELCKREKYDVKSTSKKPVVRKVDKKRLNELQTPSLNKRDVCNK